MHTHSLQVDGWFSFKLLCRALTGPVFHVVAVEIEPVTMELECKDRVVLRNGWKDITILLAYNVLSNTTQPHPMHPPCIVVPPHTVLTHD